VSSHQPFETEAVAGAAAGAATMTKAGERVRVDSVGAGSGGVQGGRMEVEGEEMNEEEGEVVVEEEEEEEEGGPGGPRSLDAMLTQAEDGGSASGDGTKAASHSLTPETSALSSSSSPSSSSAVAGEPMSPEDMLHLQVAILRDFTRAYSHHYEIWKKNHPNGVEEFARGHGHEDGDGCTGGVANEAKLDAEYENANAHGQSHGNGHGHGHGVCAGSGSPTATSEAGSGNHTPEMSSTRASPASSARLSSISIPATAEVMKAAKSAVDQFNLDSHSTVLDEKDAAALASIVGGDGIEQLQPQQPRLRQLPQAAHCAALNGLSPVRGFSLTAGEGHVPSPMDSEKVVRRAKSYIELVCAEDAKGALSAAPVSRMGGSEEDEGEEDDEAEDVGAAR